MGAPPQKSDAESRSELASVGRKIFEISRILSSLGSEC